MRDFRCVIPDTATVRSADSNVLITRFLTDGGVVELQDFMPVLRAHDPDHRTHLIRRVVAVRGSMQLGMTMAPRFDYGRQQHTAQRQDTAVLLSGGELTLRLRTSVAVSVDDDHDVHGEFELRAGEQVSFVLDAPGNDRLADQARHMDELMHRTVRFWQAWLARSTYTGRWREMVHRSALTLKLLTHEPTGAIVAAATAALPEQIGGDRNWDYRYVWIRDAAFSMYALLRLGFTDEAAAFMNWLADRFAGCDNADGGPLQPLARAVTAPFGRPCLPVARPRRGRWARRRATATMNGQEVSIDDVSRSARPRALPSRVSMNSQLSRATKTAVAAAAP